jgi:malonate transporter and related proteins
MSTVINVTLPVFAIIAAGFLFGRAKLIGAETSEALNRYVFLLAFPVALFFGTARAPLAATLNGEFVAAYVAAMLASFALTAFLAWRVLRLGSGVACLDGMAASYSNTAYLGFPLFAAAYGADRLGPAIISSVATAIVLIALCAAWLEYLKAKAGGAAGGGVRVALRIGRALVFNPLILGSVGGLAWTAVSGGAPMPKALATFCELVGGSAGPCALFSIGLFIAARPFRFDLGHYGGLVLAKLVVQPALTWALIAVFFPGLDHFWAASAVLLAAMPTGGTNFVVAQQYNTGVERASMAILLTTVLSVVTLTVLMAWFGPMR